MTKGYVSIILHSHLPFVRHPDKVEALEERWLFEAIHESYLPLIQVFDKLLEEHIAFKLSMSITPPLMEMLEDEYLNSFFLKNLNKLIALSQKELERTQNNKELNLLANFYKERFTTLLQTYEGYDHNLMNAFRKFDKLGCLEILGGPATHPYLPLINTKEEVIYAQLSTGIMTYEKHIGHKPLGMWLPECAYYDKLDVLLSELGIKYIISESKAVLHGTPSPQFATYAPIATSTGLSMFPRDIQSSVQVWSSTEGFPGDYNYREFYWDIGYELPLDYINPYLSTQDIRIATGIKYHRITDKTENKEIYNRKAALAQAKIHGEHFASLKEAQLSAISAPMSIPPILICPYDTELFGHWWFEGPEFLEAFLRKTNEKASCESYTLITPKDYLKENPILQCCTPSPSSWGANADNSMWLNVDTGWIYKDLYECQLTMIEYAASKTSFNSIQIRILNQAARELMLAEASDWPFIIKTNTTITYAIKRVTTHIENFHRLCNNLECPSSEIEVFLEGLEAVNNIFPDINYRVYRMGEDTK